MKKTVIPDAEITLVQSYMDKVSYLTTHVENERFIGVKNRMDEFTEGNKRSFDDRIFLEEIIEFCQDICSYSHIENERSFFFKEYLVDDWDVGVAPYMLFIVDKIHSDHWDNGVYPYNLCVEDRLPDDHYIIEISDGEVDEIRTAIEFRNYFEEKNQTNDEIISNYLIKKYPNITDHSFDDLLKKVSSYDIEYSKHDKIKKLLSKSEKKLKKILNI